MKHSTTRNDHPVVSVVIPTYNRFDLLKRAVRSVLSQSLQSFELLIVKNGPYLFRLPSELRDSRIRVIYEEKADAAHARNRGAMESSGRYIAFLDDDDEWLPEKLQLQVDALEAEPDAGLAACGEIVVNEDGEVIEMESKARPGIGLKDFVLHGHQIRSLSAMIVRRSAFESTGPFNSKYTISNDYDFCLRFLSRNRMINLAQPLYYYHTHAANASYDLTRMLKENISILKALQPQEGLIGSADIARGIRAQARRFFSAGIDARDSRNFREAALYFSQALRYAPSVGLDIRWGNSKGALYRFARPYLLTAYCGIKGRSRRAREGSRP